MNANLLHRGVVKLKPSLLPVLFCVAIMIVAHPTAANADSAGTLTDVANAFKVTSGAWIATALGYARHLFFALVAIELAWTAVTYVLQKDSVPDFVAAVVLKLMGVFFFLAVLQNGPTWIPYIVDSFSQAGASISGQGAVLDPSSTFGQGLALARAMLATIDSPAFFTAVVAVLLAVFCAIGVVVAFAVVAGQLMVTLIESYIVISAGLFFLGFGGSRWTLPFAEKYVGYAVSVGIKLFMLYLIVGLGQTLAAQWITLFHAGTAAPPDVYVGVAGSALVFMLLGWQIPSLAGSLMNGSPAMTLGAAGNTLATMAAGGTAIGAGALAVTGAAAAAGVAGAAAIATRVGGARLDDTTRAGEQRPIGVITPGRANASAISTGDASSFPSANNSSTAESKTHTPGEIGVESAASDGGGETVSGESVRASTENASSSQAQTLPTSFDAVAVEPSSVGTETRPHGAGASSPHAAETSPSGRGSPVMPDDTALPQLDLGPSLADKTRSSPNSPTMPGLRSIVETLRNVRIPSLPHDGAGGAVHIRFRHHDSD